MCLSGPIGRGVRLKLARLWVRLPPEALIQLRHLIPDNSA